MDQSRDISGRQMHRLLSLHTQPDYVKQAASQPDKLGTQVTELLPQQFADKAGTMFPVHNKAATWLSACYFFDKQAEFDGARAAEIRDKLYRQARLFGIMPDIQAIEKTAHDNQLLTESQLHDDDFAFIGVERGQKIRRLPIRNAGEIKAACDWMRKYARLLPYPQRRAIAERVLDKADDLSVTALSVTAELEKTAGCGTCSHLDAVALLERRIGICKQAKRLDVATGLAKLAESVSRHPELCLEPAWRQRLCEIVDQADTLTGVTVKYGSDLPMPEEELFGVTKQALANAKEQLITLTNGSVHRKEALSKLTLGDLRDELGDEVADSVSDGGLFVDMTKLSSVAPTLPRFDADRLDRLLQRDGVSPLMKQAASTDAIDPAQLRALGRQYVLQMR